MECIKGLKRLRTTADDQLTELYVGPAIAISLGLEYVWAFPAARAIRSDLAQAISVPEPIIGRPITRLASWYTVTLLILGAWLYAPVLLRLAHQWWSDPNFSHGFFVPVFS